MLKCSDGNPAPAQQLKIALSRSALPALTTDTPEGHTHILLCPLASPHQVHGTPKGQQVLKYAEKKKKINQKEQKYIQGLYAVRGERNKSRGERVFWGLSPMFRED